MAVLINDTCINCGACIEECPVEAIVDEDDNPTGTESYYVNLIGYTTLLSLKNLRNFTIFATIIVTFN